MKKHLIPIVLGIFFILLIPVFAIKDMDYDANKKIASISENGEDIVDIQLIYNTDFCYIFCESVIQVTPLQDFKVADNDALADLDYNTKYYKYRNNGMDLREDLFKTNQLLIWDDKHFEWDTFKYKNFNFKEGETYLIKNRVQKQNIFQDIEWIPTFYGVEINQWAAWNFSENLEAYYNFDADSSDSSGNGYNGTDFLAHLNTTNYKLGAGSYSFFDGNYAVNISQDMSGIGAAWSISFWMYTTTESGVNSFWGQVGGVPNTYCYLENTKIGCTILGVGDYVSDAGQFEDDHWYHVVLAFSTTHQTIWINGSIVNDEDVGGSGHIVAAIPFTLGNQGESGTSGFNGELDEYGIWGETLNQTSVDILYNADAGYNPLNEVTINLDTPADNTEIGLNKSDFTCSGNIPPGVGNSWDNVTMYLWNSSGDLIDTNLSTASGLVFNANFTMYNLGVDLYDWNCLGIDNASGEHWSEANFTLNSNSSLVEDITYDATIESSAETEFILNLSSKNTPEVTLTYNFTNYSTDCSLTNDYFICNATLNAPTFSGFDPISIPFNFTINDSIINYLSDTNNQTVTPFLFVPCNASINQSGINFTLLDETNFTQMNGTLKATFIYWINGTSPSVTGYNNLSLISSDKGIHEFCISPNSTNLLINASIDYTSSGYVTRSYFLTEYDVNNVSQNINLYLVNTSALEHHISIIDQDNNPLVGAFIQVQRYYKDLGIAQTVEILQTDSSGRDLAHFGMVGEEYQFIVIFKGTVLYTGTPFKPYCPQSAVGEPCEREIRVGTATSRLTFNPFLTFTDNLSYNNETDVITYSWTETSGATPTGRLYVLLKGIPDIEICNVSATSASATLVCNVSAQVGTGEIFAYAYNTKSLERVERFLSIGSDNYKIFGDDGIFWSFVIIFTTVCLGLATRSVMNVAIYLVMGLILVSAMGLMYIPYFALMGLITAIGIIIFKMRST